MDWIKKHYEKIVLALMLILLIASAVLLSLKVGQLSQEVRDAPRRAPKSGKPTQAINLGKYNDVLKQLQEPPLWTYKERDLTSPNASAQIIDQIGNTDTNKLPVLRGVRYAPFNLLFMAYTGEGRNFQLNFLTRARTYLVAEVDMEVGDRYSKTGYFIKKFEQKKSPSPGGSGELDVSELTLQHEGEDPIVLVLNRVKEGREPIAQVQCPQSTDTRNVRRGDPIRCTDMTWNVVDITPKQMLIRETKSGKQDIVPLSAPGR